MTESRATRPLSRDDLDEVLALIRAAEETSPEPLVTTRDDLMREFDEPTRDLAADTLAVVSGGGELMAYVMTSLHPEPVRRRSLQISGRVHPRHRGNGLGTELVSWAIRRGRERLGSHDDGLPKELRTYLYESDTAARAIYEAHGLEVDRSFVEMERDLSEPIDPAPLPPSLELRTWSRDLDEAVRRAHNESFAEHWGSEPLSTERWARWLSGTENFLPDASFVVLDGEEVVGYTMNAAYPEEWEGLGHSEGWINGLGTRPAWRGRGIASALIARSCLAFRDLGHERAALGVDSDNATGALGLYERHGFRSTRREISLGAPVLASDD